MLYKNETKAELQEGEEYFFLNVDPYGLKHAKASKRRIVLNRNIYAFKKYSFL